MSTQINLVLYVNGFRFYPQTVSFTGGDNDLGSFSVTVPAVPEWALLQHRAHGAVFFVDPCTRGWRLLAEGEYVSTSVTEQADGSRSRSLVFKALHDVWARVPYCSWATAFREMPENALPRALINGVEMGQQSAYTEFFSLDTLIAQVSTSTTRISETLPALVESVLMRAPVEAFYYRARRLSQKMYSLPDSEIGTVIDNTRFFDLARSGFSDRGFSFDTRLRTIIDSLAAIGFYKSVAVPAPPTVGDRVHETLFIPHLYHAIPPACNVIFKDQVQLQQLTRNTELEPTRVVTQLLLPGAAQQSPLPAYYMANEPDDGRYSRNLLQAGLSGEQALTHDLLSREELLRGVLPVVTEISLERLGIPNGQASGTVLSRYLAQASRHHYEVERGRHRTVVLHCYFLPYVAPGFPCLVELGSGPIMGMLSSVSHSLNASGEPSTTLTVSHVRDVYTRAGFFRSPPLPPWLNAAFRPDRVADTYAALFGTNLAASPYAAAVPSSVLAAAVSDAAGADTLGDVDFSVGGQVDIDRVLGTVVSVPAYDASLRPIGAVQPSTTADRIRSEAKLPPLAHELMLRHQFRAGTYLSDYLAVHGLRSPAGNTIDDGQAEPPADLASPGSPTVPLFGSPAGIRLRDANGGAAPMDGEYGPWELVAPVGGSPVSDARRQAARIIQQALTRRIS